MAELRVKSTGTLKLFESDNTSSVTIASPASLGADRTVTLPDGDVTLVAGTMSTGLTGWSTDSGTNDSLDPASASAGIYLGVAAATAANLLDDYEEGTFTPVLGGASGTSGQSYGLQGGNYVKIGDRVFIDANTSLSTKGTITGNVQIQGLPFTSKTGDAYRASACHSYIHTWSLSSGENMLNSLIYDNTAVVALGESDVNNAEAWTALTTSQVNNASEINTSISYTTA